MCVERIKVFVMEVGIVVVEVGMIVVEGSIFVIDVGGIVIEVGMIVIEGSDIIVEVIIFMVEDICDIVLLILVVDFFNEEVDERELKFIEIVLFVLNNVVEFCMILLDLLILFLLSKVVWFCEFKSEDVEFEVGMDDRVVRLIWVVDIFVVVKFIIEVFVGVKIIENVVFEFNIGIELFKFVINVEDDLIIGLLLENIDGINEELMLKCLFELVIIDIVDEVVFVVERVEFIDLVIVFDIVVGFFLVFEVIVEFIGILEFVVSFIDIEKNDEFVILVKFGFRLMFENKLVN